MSAPEHADLTIMRLNLLAGGYDPIPIVAHDAPGKSPGKRPALDGWQGIEITPDVGTVQTLGDHAAWAKAGSALAIRSNRCPNPARACRCRLRSGPGAADRRLARPSHLLRLVHASIHQEVRRAFGDRRSDPFTGTVPFRRN